MVSGIRLERCAEYVRNTRAASSESARGYVRSEYEPTPGPVMLLQNGGAQEGTEPEDGATESESRSIVASFRPKPEPEDKVPALSVTLAS
jgi:hypothetical protein